MTFMKRIFLTLSLTLTLVMAGLMLHAQTFGDLQKLEKHEGFFDFYYGEQSGKLYLVVDELEKEFLYVHALSEGMGSNDLGLKEKLAEEMGKGEMGEGEVKAYRSALLKQIEENKVKHLDHLPEIPPGAPIGMECMDY